MGITDDIADIYGSLGPILSEACSVLSMDAGDLAPRVRDKPALSGNSADAFHWGVEQGLECLRIVLVAAKHKLVAASAAGQ
jgi:hypothetical protein